MSNLSLLPYDEKVPISEEIVQITIAKIIKKKLHKSYFWPILNIKLKN